MVQRKTILITGASTGIGLALAKRLMHSNCYNLVLTARGSSLSRFLANGITESKYLWIRPLDVLEKGQRELLIDEIEAKLGQVDILINNAAYSLRAVVEHIGDTDQEKQMETNFRAPFSLIRRVLPKMRKKRFGKIINVSSVGGMMAMPTMALYSASKFALEGASESLWYEVKPWNIDVTLVQPGFINSNSHKNVKLTAQSLFAQRNPHEPYFAHYNFMSKFIQKMMKLTHSTSDSVAKKIVRVIEMQNPPLRVAGTIDAYMFSIIRRFLPRRLYHGFLYWYLPWPIKNPIEELDFLPATNKKPAILEPSPFTQQNL